MSCIADPSVLPHHLDNNRRPAERLTRGRSRRWPGFAGGFAVFLLAAAGARAQSAFGPPAGITVGSSVTQNVTVNAQANGTVSKAEVLTFGASGLDFAQSTTGASSCPTATFSAGVTSCYESVTFTPTAPGPRVGAVVLTDGSGHLFGEQLIWGTGSGGLGVLDPGNLIPVAGQAGQYSSVSDGHPAIEADLDLPASVVLDGNGNMYIADSLHNRIRMVCGPNTTATIAGTSCSLAGIISTIAGNGDPGDAGNGAAAKLATLNSPAGLALDGAGNLYIADTGNSEIREINAVTGIISVVAGGGSGCGNGSPVGDGCAAASASLNAPWGVTVDAAGDLFIADTADHRIREIAAGTGIISTVAGDGFTNPDGTGGYAGDGGLATAAKLNRPFAVAFDASGNMYIADSANNVVREVVAVAGAITPASTITTFAGNYALGEGYSGDGGPSTSAQLWAPSGVAVDPAGDVYIADSQNAAIRKVGSATGPQPGEIATVVGSGTGVDFYNGNINVDFLYGPIGLFIDSAGNIYFADYYNMVIREIQSNFAVLDFTDLGTVSYRQSSTSPTQMQPVANDGNAPLDVTGITTSTNSEVDSTVGSACNTGSPYLAPGATCFVGAVFAPAATPPLTSNQEETPSIYVAEDTLPPPASIVASNSPLDIELVGEATPVNSTTTTLTSNPDPSTFGQSVTFTATVTTGAGTGNLTGTVTFTDTYNGSATTLAADVALNPPAGTTVTASFSTSSLGVGVHSVTATYSNANDPSHFGSVSAPALIQTVDEATTTALQSSLNPSQSGESVTFTATVTVSAGGGVTPEGTVTFTDGANVLQTVPLNTTTGQAQYTTSSLAQGAHAIVASYSGDAGIEVLESSSPVLNQDVQAPSSIVLISSPNPSNYGSPVTFTATVTGTVAATGVVNFFDNGVLIGTGTLSGNPGVAAFITSSLTVGTHPITAAYPGDASNGGSTTPAPLSQMVTQTQTSTAVTASPVPGIAGAPVTITAAVSAVQGSATATGTVIFTNGTTVLGSATLGAGGIAAVTPILTPGSYQIVASYGGDANDNLSASAPLPYTVVLATTQTVVTSSQNSALVQAPVVFTAKVTGNGGIPTGPVTFYSDGNSIGAANLDATGTATFTDSALPAGTHSITASYAGDVNDSASTSAAISQVIGTLPTSTNLGAASTGGVNPQVILAATVTNSGVSGTTPTGTVTFVNGTSTIGQATLNSSGVATLTLNLPSGTYSIVANYSGDTMNSPSSSQPVSVSTVAEGFNLSVSPPTVSLAASQNATVTVSLTSTDGFTDTVGLGCASLPAAVTCHFTSPSVTLAANSTQTAQLTIDTNSPLTGGSSAMNTPAGGQRTAPGTAPGTELAGIFLPVGLFFGWLFWRLRRRGALLTLVLLFALSGASFFLSGCNGFSMASAAPGTYTIQVTGTGANSEVVHYQNVTLNITK
ncbi:MAG: Ig-like domain repeat protein [Terracidiphilus sp.]